jgi:predicted ATPase/transcriptional regulator with XRE-family HTH domain
MKGSQTPSRKAVATDRKSKLFFTLPGARSACVSIAKDFARAVRRDRRQPGRTNVNERAFGDLLREYRCAAGLSQEALAERARLSPGAISTLERSARRAPQQQTLSLLADALELDSEKRARLEVAALAGRRRAVRGQPVARVTTDPFPTNLPSPLTSFHGRDEELDLVTRSLASRRCVSLVGTGGVGKTRLAVEAARERLDRQRYPAGIWFVDLAPLHAPELIAPAIARLLGVRENADEPPLSGLASALATKRALLVLDNCEHVIDECARVAETLMRECPGIDVLATTREALRIEGECVVSVAPLAYGSDDSESPALDLLTNRLIDTDFSRYSNLGFAERAYAATICRRLDGVPLALELAAGRARELPLSEIVARLAERFSLLTEGRRTALPRQYTLRGAIDWSFELLEEPQREIFARLGLFSGTFGAQAAGDICAEDRASVRAALDALVAKSLVTIVDNEAGGFRYRLLETMRAYALDRLHERGEYEHYARRFAATFTRMATEADARYGRMPARAFVDSVEPDLDNFRAALNWTLAEGNDLALGAELAGAMGWVYRQLALFSEGTRWCVRALDAVPGLDSMRRGRLLMALSFFYFNIGSMKRALDSAADAAAAYRSAGARPEIAWALTQQAYCHYRFGRLDEARLASEEAVRLAREADDTFRLAGALNAFALTIPPERSPERFAALEEAVAAYRLSGDEDAIVPTAHLAAAHYEAKQFAAAFACSAEVVAIARRNRDRSTLSSALINAAAYALALDDVPYAESAALEALELVADLGKTLNAMCALQHLGSVATIREDFIRAARLVGASDALYREFELERELTEQTLYDRTLDEIRAALGEEQARVQLARGGSAPFQVVVAEALDRG